MVASDGSSGERTPDGVLVTAVQLSSLVALVVLLFDGFSTVLDLHWWDEAIYYRQGVELLHGHVDGRLLAWGAGLSVAYAALSRLPLGGVHPGDAMMLLCAMASTVALWWSFQRMLPGLAAWGIAAWWAGTLPGLIGAQPMMQTSIYVFVAALHFTALGCVVRGRHTLALALLAYAAVTRPESAFFTMIYGAILTIVAAQRRRGVITMVTGVAIATVHLTLPAAQDRSWLVFRQHYAMGVAERIDAGDGVAIALAHADPDPIVARSFGEVDSIAQAALASPGALAEHMLDNLGALSAPLTELCGSAFAHAPTLRWTLLAALVALIVIGLARGRQMQRGWRTPAPSRLVWAFLLAGLVAIPLNLLVRPRRELLLAVLPLLFAVVGCAAAAGSRRVWAGSAVARWAGLMVPVALTALIGFWSTRPFGPLVDQLPLQRTVQRMLARHPLPPGSSLLAHNASNIIRWSNQHGEVEALDLLQLCQFARSPYPDLATLIDQRQPDHLLITETLIQFEGLPRQILTAVEDPAWELVDLSPVAMLYRRAR